MGWGPGQPRALPLVTAGALDSVWWTGSGSEPRVWLLVGSWPCSVLKLHIVVRAGAPLRVGQQHPQGQEEHGHRQALERVSAQVVGEGSLGVREASRGDPDTGIAASPLTALGWAICLTSLSLSFCVCEVG